MPDRALPPRPAYLGDFKQDRRFPIRPAIEFVPPGPDPLGKLWDENRTAIQFDSHSDDDFTPIERTRQRARSGEVERHRARAERYGITEEALHLLLDTSRGRCAICACKIDRAGVVDHSHASGDVRGHLCHRYNLGIGHFADSPERLRAAAAYLEQTGGTTQLGQLVAAVDHHLKGEPPSLSPHPAYDFNALALKFAKLGLRIDPRALERTCRGDLGVGSHLVGGAGGAQATPNAASSAR